MPADKMAGLERLCNLSEDLLRFMFTRADHLEAEQIEAAEGREALKEEIAVRAQQAEAGTSDSGVRATTRSEREAEEEASEATEAEVADQAPQAEVAGDDAPEAGSDEPVAAADA